MALLWMDGFDNYGSTAAGAQPAMFANGYAGVIGTNDFPQTVNPRTGTHSFRMVGTTDYLMKTIPGRNTIGVGVEFSVSALPGAPANGPAIVFHREDGLGIHMGVYTTPTGVLKARLLTATGTFLGSSGTQMIFPNSWHHIEVRVFCHDTLGTVEVRVDGAPSSTSRASTPEAAQSAT